MKNKSCNARRSFLPSRGKVFLFALLIAGVLITGGCGDDSDDSSTGACVATGGMVNECKQNWTSGECADWNAQQVNGSTWTFHSGATCPGLGYSVQCPNGSFVMTGGDC